MICIKGLILVQLLARNFELWLNVLFENICETFSENELIFPKLDNSLEGVHYVKVVLLRTKDILRRKYKLTLCMCLPNRAIDHQML